MKGKTTIILTNVETGEQEIHEDENLITNALDKLISINVAMGLNLNDYVLPFANKALGGIMLFDRALTEDADNLHFPADAHLVAYASQDANTTDSHRGSYNATESGKNALGFVSVWDFGTSQANGSIKAVARTSAHAGQDPLYWYNAPTYQATGNGSPATDRGWYPIRYDSEYIYMLKADSTNHIMRMARAKIPMLRLGVADWRDVERSLELVASWSTEVCSYTWYNTAADMENDRNPREQYVYADDPVMYEDGHDGFLYCMFYKATRPYTHYDYNLNWFTIKYMDGSYDKSSAQRANIGADYWSDATAHNMNYAGRWRGHIHNGLLYRMSGNRKIIYKIPLANPNSYSATRIFADSNPDYVEDLGMIMSRNGGLYIECYHYTETGYNRLNGMLYPDGTLVLPDFSYQGSGNSHNNDLKYTNYCYTCDDDMTVWGYYDGEKITRMWAAAYLGTINNLASEIVKTPSQTMKIVYTLTDVDEEDEGEGEGS